jgi:hypothetical protein
MNALQASDAILLTYVLLCFPEMVATLAKISTAEITTFIVC